MINYQQGFQENDVMKWRLWMNVEIESTVTFFRNSFCENAELSHNIRIKRWSRKFFCLFQPIVLEFRRSEYLCKNMSKWLRK